MLIILGQIMEIIVLIFCLFILKDLLLRDFDGCRLGIICNINLKIFKLVKIWINMIFIFVKLYLYFQ